MPKPKSYIYLAGILSSLLLSLSVVPFVFAAETITIDTYYPSPYGSYRELRAQRMAIGDNYYDSAYCWPPTACANQINNEVNLVVEGKVGIGNFSPVARLDVKGVGSASSTYGLGVRNSSNVYVLAVSDGGNVGVGVVPPAYKLDVNGTVNMTGFRMPTGAAAGKILTSNASGDGSWGNGGNISCNRPTGWVCHHAPTNFFFGFYCDSGTVTHMYLFPGITECETAPAP